MEWPACELCLHLSSSFQGGGYDQLYSEDQPHYCDGYHLGCRGICVHQDGTLTKDTTHIYKLAKDTNHTYQGKLLDVPDMQHKSTQPLCSLNNQLQIYPLTHLKKSFATILTYQPAHNLSFLYTFPPTCTTVNSCVNTTILFTPTLSLSLRLLSWQ